LRNLVHILQRHYTHPHSSIKNVHLRLSVVNQG
jgi:hypothetical protein